MTLRRAATALMLLLALSIPGQSASAQGKASAKRDPRWIAISRTFGQDGEVHDGYFRVNLPRTDLAVRVGNDVLEPPFELTSYVGFVPVGTRDVLAMGEMVLRDDEVAGVMSELRRQGIGTPALHNHLIGETPRIMFIHVMARGTAESVATKLRAAFAKSATPMQGPTEVPPDAQWSALDAILGAHAEASGHTAEYEFPRRERITVGGVAVKSTGVLETASEVVFQQLGNGRAACGGELFVSPSEVDAVARALDEHGLHVTAIHNHMIEQTPQMYWLHWYGVGEAATLARGVAAALAHTNGARTSVHEE